MFVCYTQVEEEGLVEVLLVNHAALVALVIFCFLDEVFNFLWRIGWKEGSNGRVDKVILGRFYGARY